MTAPAAVTLACLALAAGVAAVTYALAVRPARRQP